MSIKKEAKKRKPGKLSCPKCSHGVCVPAKLASGKTVFRCTSCKHDFITRRL